MVNIRVGHSLLMIALLLEMYTLCPHLHSLDAPEGYLVRISVLEGQPLANELHVSLMNDPYLPGVIVCFQH